MRFDHDDLTRHFGQIWPVHNARFCDLLITLRRQFGGDLDRMLVLAVIGARNLAWGRIAGLSYGQFTALEWQELQAAPINVQSIADYSGIPRETVRRKLQELQRAGWVTKREDGCFIATAQAATDLAPATEATMNYLVAIGAACVEAAAKRG